VSVDVLNSGGGRAAFTIPSLPAPSGDSLLAKVDTAMNALTAYQYNEVLNPGTENIRGSYSLVAPDRMTWTIKNTGGTVIYIGTTQYVQNGPGQPWQRQPSPAATVPYFVWDHSRPLTNAHVIGEQVLDGIPTTMVGSFGNARSTPIWFTFWIDASGRVRQVVMDAPGHFMTDTYTSYDKPVDIVAPIG
jgi:hypothetical protein